MAKKKDLKAVIEAEIAEMLEAKDKEPSEGRLKALALGIKMCALNAKLEESTYGDFFSDAGDAGSVSEREARSKSHARSREDDGITFDA